MIIDVSGYTNVGLVRSTNQDSVLVRAEKNYGLFVVADGMGGHSGGDYASQTIIRTLASWWDGGAYKKVSDIEGLASECKQQLETVSSEIHGQFKQAGLVGGSTVVVVIVNETQFATLTLGDSHIYRLCSGNMIPLSVDDVWENLPSTRESMTDEEIANDSRKGKLTAAIGAVESVDVHVQIFEQGEEEYLMLCSDGIYKYIGADELSQGFASGAINASAKELSDMLSQYVLANGASDNFTVAICRTKKSSGLGYVPSANHLEVVTEANCDIKIASEIYNKVEIFKSKPTNVSTEESVETPVVEATSEPAEEKPVSTPVATPVATEEKKPTESKIANYLELIKQKNAILIMIIAALVIMAIIIGAVIANKSKKKKPTIEETDVVESTEAIEETTEATIETTVPVETFSTVNDNIPLIITGNPDDVNATALESTCKYFGDFDGDGITDGIKVSFAQTDFGVEPILTLLDSNGEDIVGTNRPLKEIVNLQYSESDIVGLLSPSIGGRTTLFMTVVNNDGRDVLVAYYAGLGLNGNKIVSVIGRVETSYNLINMYTNIGGSMQVMFPISGANPELSPVDQMCNQHLGMDYDNVGEEEMNSGVWAMGTQIVGIVYNE